MNLTRKQLDLCGELFQYALAKLNANDGWSCLSFVDTIEGRIANVYQDDSVEAAMSKALEEIRTIFDQVSDYATAFDGGWHTKAGDEIRAIIVDSESFDTEAIRLAYIIHETSPGIFERLTDDIIRFPTALPAFLYKTSNAEQADAVNRAKPG